nr:RecName: Full=Unknown protein 14 [Pseudotsuga menziesii]
RIISSVAVAVAGTA